jgi:hypothetical protein
LSPLSRHVLQTTLSCLRSILLNYMGEKIETKTWKGKSKDKHVKCNTADQVLHWDLGKPGAIPNFSLCSWGKLLPTCKRISKIPSQHKTTQFYTCQYYIPNDLSPNLQCPENFKLELFLGFKKFPRNRSIYLYHISNRELQSTWLSCK